MTDNILLEQALKICRNLLDINPPYTQEKIIQTIENVRKILTLDNEAVEILKQRLGELGGVEQGESSILERREVEPWVIEKWSSAGQSRKFWKRYRDYMGDEKKIAPKVLARLDQLTDRILDQLADPEKHDEFDKRGLVVGHVQSGKTSNYLGLITKAADAGYRIIVVLAGIHNSLRSQTQLRVDEGFLGYDTITSRSFNESNNRIGVGRYDRDCPAQSLTSSAPNGDFKKNLSDVGFYLEGPTPTVVVIKKNNAVLKNLIFWLGQKLGHDTPEGRVIDRRALMLIDDEADNASINISKGSVSSINGSIRALLKLFRKSAYVGYTATPYANVFIPQPDDNEDLTKGLKIVANNRDYPIGEDLFPRDFIINISPPSNYIGAEKFFGIVNENNIYEEKTLPDQQDGPRNSIIHLYEPVSDHQPHDYFVESITEHIREVNDRFIPDKHKLGDAMPSQLPDTLCTALMCFILACAARRLRNQSDEHNSMLVHVTRFVDWQNHIALLVEDELNTYKNYIELENRNFLAQLRSIWEENFITKTAEMLNATDIDHGGMKASSWEEVQLELFPAVFKIQVRAVHGSKLLGGLEPANIEALDYYEHRNKGLSVIAVGGNKLSRGLTLEGLTISYYLRSSKMYDTLMQMGRWFGYRPGYLDLCRLFTTTDLVGHYKHITRATEEMRGEFDRMAQLRRRPDQYGLKVRAHDGVLTITAANKFRYKKMMSFSYAGQLEETWQFDKANTEVLLANFKRTQVFIATLGHPTGPRNSSKHTRLQQTVWYQRDNYNAITEYIRSYGSDQPSFHTGLLADYIDRQARIGKLTNWTVAVVNNSFAKAENQVDFSGYQVGMSYRRDDSGEGSRYYELVKSHIIGNFHEYIDLDDLQLETALAQTQNDRKDVGKDLDCEHPSPARIRSNRAESNGLLLIYALNPKPAENQPAYLDKPIIGLAISFPEIEEDDKVIYAVNDVFQKELYDYPDELDNEDLESDEEEELIRPQQDRMTGTSTETFMDMIENNRHSTLDESEFFSGIIPRYPDKDYGSVELEKPNLIMEDFVVGQSWPFYSEKDIQQYYLNSQLSQYIIRPERGALIEGDYLIGLKRSKYVTFSYHKGTAAFSDSCWIIKSPRFAPKYLVALFNSALFGAYLRIRNEQKKGNYFIKSEVLYSFPIVPPANEEISLFERIYDLLEAVGKQESRSGSGTMKSYFTSILDVMVFGLYYPVSMKDNYGRLMKSLQEAIPEQMPLGEDLVVLGERLFQELHDRQHPVREIVFALDNINKVARIRSTFTQ